MIVKNGLVHDAVSEKPYEADIVIKNGVIASICRDGQAASSEEGEPVIDASGLHVYPGLVDAHSHVGLCDFGMGKERSDLNETSDIISPQLRGIDSFYPQDKAVSIALEHGITTVCTGPGSLNVLGGTFTAIKMYGNCADKMTVKKEAAMKCAFGENPIMNHADAVNSTRMHTAGLLREALLRARDYMRRKENAEKESANPPAFDVKYEAMIPLLKRDMPLKVHAHRADDICTAIRVAKEFDLKLTLEHCTEGRFIVDELVEAGCPVAVGPLISGSSKKELANQSIETPRILSEAGLRVSIITDAPVVPQKYLALTAMLAVNEGGMNPFYALQAITINAARHIGIEERVGSIECGKDGDLVLADGDILVNKTKIKAVVVNGDVVVDRFGN